MLRICAICGKGAQTGKVVTRKGLVKSKGGTGSKIARWSKRKFLPNLHRLRIRLHGKAVNAYICSKCIKKGNLIKA